MKRLVCIAAMLAVSCTKSNSGQNAPPPAAPPPSNDAVIQQGPAHTGNNYEIKCTGMVAGVGGEVKIDQNVLWAGTEPQKSILMPFGGTSDHAGEYSLRLKPGTVSEKPSLEIFGWFVDSTKNESARGGLEKPVSLNHQDTSKTHRKVDITCAMTNAISSVRVSPKAPLRFVCDGFVAASANGFSQKEEFSQSFEWDGKESSDFLISDAAGSGKLIAKVQSAADGDDQMITLQAVGVDQHVTTMSIGGIQSPVSLKHISAFDHRNILVRCKHVTD